MRVMPKIMSPGLLFGFRVLDRVDDAVAALQQHRKGRFVGIDARQIGEPLLVAAGAAVRACPPRHHRAAPGSRLHHVHGRFPSLVVLLHDSCDFTQVSARVAGVWTSFGPLVRRCRYYRATNPRRRRLCKAFGAHRADRSPTAKAIRGPRLRSPSMSAPAACARRWSMRRGASRHIAARSMSRSCRAFGWAEQRPRRLVGRHRRGDPRRPRRQVDGARRAHRGGLRLRPDARHRAA